MTSFLSDFAVYVGRIRQFDRGDWLVYAVWVGLMLGLCASTGGFLLVGHAAGVSFPAEAWMVPIGAIIFSIAISIDTIGHRTVYKEVLAGGEALVHHVTIFAGIGSCVMLCAAYPQRTGFAIVAAVLTALSFVYSLIDEVFHWRRDVMHKSDRVEMWSHVFILVGHGTMMLGWWLFYLGGYQGVAETLEALP
jgi:hypothetical protein